MTTTSIEDSVSIKIRKRSGRIVGFDQERVTDAIWKAAQSVGGNDRSVANKLSIQVRNLVLDKHGYNTILTVEHIQDVVERVLIDNGHARTAKSYILYRQKRAEIREEKRKILEKEDVDEVDKAFDPNALRVLKARYLRKDEKGKLKETPRELFTRVAVHVTIPSILYDGRIFDISANQPEHPEEEFNPNELEDTVSIGEYPLNQYHLQGVKRVYDRFNGDGKIRVTWTTFLNMLKEGEFNNYEDEVKQYYRIMVEKSFMPNTPAIANFGNPLGMGSACFVMGVEDNMESIMETLKRTAIVFKSGGGMGYNFSKLRPEGDYVSSTSGVASGPISFMKLFDTMTEVIKQGGIRRGANMGILNINHPDIEKFIKAKSGNKALKNFNISVLITPDFWEYYERNESYPLVNPRNGEVDRKVNPRMLFDMIVFQAWESAEPGVIFYDHVNDTNPLFESLGPIVTTNPCGEVLLYPNESCNLGSINVWFFAKPDTNGEMKFDWTGLAEAVQIATRFLDNVIDVNKFPLKELEEMTLATRKIGLGVMGLGDLFYDMKVVYNSDEGRKFMERLMQFINYHSKLASIQLAKDRGSFPYYNKSFYPKGRLPFRGYEDRSSWHFDWSKLVDEIKNNGLRNCYTTIVAPTGSISMIAGCSSGMEPIYSLIFEKRVKVGSFYYVDPVFEKVMTAEGLHDDELLKTVSESGGSIQNIPYIPSELKKIFITSHNIAPEDHIQSLAIFQKWVDSSVSKTNNFPADATVDDMKKSYQLAYKLGCKDVTVYRDTSIKDQVLVTGKKQEDSTREAQPNEEATVEVPMDKSVLTTQLKSHKNKSYEGTGIEGSVEPFVTNYLQSSPIPSPPIGPQEMNACPICSVSLSFSEGCARCPGCGWGICS